MKRRIDCTPHGAPPMKIPVWTKPAIYGAVAGAVVMAIVGFNYMGWTTSHTAQRMAQEEATTAVVAALLPLCVAKARDDADPARLVKLRGETSSYSRSEQVRAAGWATMPGMTGPNANLATACSERLATASTGG